MGRREGRAGRALPCAYHERVEDSLLNRVLLAGLWMAAGTCHSGALAGQLRRLARLLQAGVGDVRFSQAVLGEGKRAVDRLTAGYGPTLELITLLYEAFGVDEGERLLRPIGRDAQGVRAFRIVIE